MRVWVNGSVLEDSDAAVLPVTDHGFTVGDGVFESIKVTDSVPFALTRHLERLRFSARGLGLGEPDHDEVRTAVADLLALAPLPLGRLRVTYTAGPGPLGSGRGDGAPTLVVVAVPMEPWDPTTFVVTVPWTRNERSAVAGLKTTSYAENVVALVAARQRGASEAIFANTTGMLCEGTGSNIFYVVGGELRTPSLASGCLGGITRALLLEWTDARQVDEPIEVLDVADEIFIASTTRDVQPVARCDERTLVAPGPVTAATMATWSTREQESSDP